MFSDELKNPLLELVFQRKLDKYGESLLSSAAPAIALEPLAKSDADIPTGKSKLGGDPDVPAGFEWPCFEGRAISFLAQIDMKESAASLPDGPLPKEGLLSFFYDDSVWGFDPKDRGAFRVYHFNCKTEQLQRQAAPLPTSKKFFFGIFEKKVGARRYKPCRIELNPFLCLTADSDSLGLSEAESECYFELLEDIGKHHRLLGFAEPIQSPDMELECELVTNGLYCGNSTGFNDPRAIELKKNAEGWRLLLQLDSECKESDMMWGDAGRVYFWIREADLLAADFANCWLISQCY